MYTFNPTSAADFFVRTACSHAEAQVARPAKKPKLHLRIGVWLALFDITAVLYQFDTKFLCRLKEQCRSSATAKAGSTP